MDKLANKKLKHSARPDRRDAEEAVRTMIRWAGDDPAREGLAGTPERVIRAYEEFFAGYELDPAAILGRTFEQPDDDAGMVLIRDIPVASHCEHHIVPILGTAHVAYLPGERVVGLSKIARLVDAYAKRLQIQETLTVQIARTINDVLKPEGVAVVVEAAHQCMTTRGVKMPGVVTVTRKMLGRFETDTDLRAEFLALIRPG